MHLPLYLTLSSAMLASGSPDTLCYAPNGMTRSYDHSNRPRRTAKASGARGWYDSPEWKARSRAYLERHLSGVRRGTRRGSATTSSPRARTIARVSCAGQSSRCAGRATARPL